MNSVFLKGWDFDLNGDNTKLYFKDRFNIAYDDVNNPDVIEMTVYENGHKVDLPFETLDQAICWCEGRLYDVDNSVVKVKYDELVDDVKKRMTKIGSVMWFDDNGVFDEDHYYKGRSGSGVDHVYAVSKKDV